MPPPCFQKSLYWVVVSPVTVGAKSDHRLRVIGVAIVQVVGHRVSSRLTAPAAAVSVTFENRGSDSFPSLLVR